jgi:hypothetical protein
MPKSSLSLVKSIKLYLIAFSISMLLILSINLIAHLTDTSKIRSIVLDADHAGQLEYLKDTSKDSFTECALLTMQIIRESNVWLDTFNTKLGGNSSEHSCIATKELVEKGAISDISSYINYWFGARYFAQILFSFMDFSQMQLFYYILSYAVFLSFGVCCYLRSRWLGVLFTPLVLLSFLGFGLEKLGENIGHAPGFIFPMILLSLLVFYRERFESMEMRLIFFVFLGVVTTYFDLLTGAIPFTFILAITLNHFLYHSTIAFVNKSKSFYSESLMFSFILILTFVSTIGAKLLILNKIFDIPTLAFKAGLSSRIGNVFNGEVITYPGMLGKLWSVRNQFFGSFALADIFYYIAFSSWIFALITTIIFFVKKKRSDAIHDFLILLFGGLGVVIWYFIFLNHTYVHVLHMGRIAIIPLSFGMTALIVCIYYLKSALRNVNFYITSLIFISFLIGFLGMSRFTNEQMPVYSFIINKVDNTSGVDQVSCSPLGTTKDGVPDELISFEITPQNIFYNRGPLQITQIQLVRNTPPGAYETNQQNFILGVGTSQTGPLVNNSNGSVNIPVVPKSKLRLNYCADNADTKQSLYQIRIKINGKMWVDSFKF